MKREKALVDSRREEILQLLKSKTRMSVPDIADAVGVSHITVRRDLQTLEDGGRISRHYGGAEYMDPAHANYANETEMYRDLIAQYAASLVKDNDIIFINTSKTASRMLIYIKSKNVTVITNNANVILTEYSPDVKVILTGGELRHPKATMVGDYAIRNLMTVTAKKCFVGCSGISPTNGMTTQNANEVNLNSIMLERVTEGSYILADHNKVGVTSNFTSLPASEITNVITDELAPASVLHEFERMGVAVHIVKKDVDR